MTDHFAEAEEYLRIAHQLENADLARIHVAEAQVHATLATVQRDRQRAAADELSRETRDVYEVAEERVASTADFPTGARTIPWPPSEERVARELAALDGRPWDALLPIRQDDYRAKARAVLDAIGSDPNGR